ncbi:MAG: Minf_1886 family protein [Phycisphaerales bacterium]
MAKSIAQSVSRVTVERRTYPAEAMEFVREGLAHTVRMVHGGEVGDAEIGENSHVTGRQLCIGLRSLAVEKWGRLAGVVLRRWGVRETLDFGRIVFDMVESGVLRTSEEDTIEDFRDVYAFDEAFGCVEVL